MLVADNRAKPTSAVPTDKGEGGAIRHVDCLCGHIQC
jgi:hypothetical protein